MKLWGSQAREVPSGFNGVELLSITKDEGGLTAHKFTPPRLKASLCPPEKLVPVIIM